MSEESAVVFVVDDDHGVRAALCRLVESAGYRVLAFGSAAEFLQSEWPDCPGCLVLDLRLPEIDGLELQKELAGKDAPPIVFITGHGDIPSSVRAMKAGAIEFLAKPFGDEELMGAVEAGIALDRTSRQKRLELAELRKRYRLLTPREREVLSFVVAGLSNKQAAGELHIAENTIAVHRGQIMRKMGAHSLAELVRVADKLGIEPIGPPT